jgi:hypothetical protein
MEQWPELIETCKNAECGGCTALEDPTFRGNPNCSHRWMPSKYVQGTINEIHKIIKESRKGSEK